MAVVTLPPRNPASAFADMAGHHVALRVADFQAAKDFYVGVLDFRVVHEWPFADERLAYLALPNDDFMIELLGGGDPAPAEPPRFAELGASLSVAGYHHFCITVADMDATVAALRARGVAIVAEPFRLDAIGRRLAFLADPFGNLIELAQVVA